MADIYRYTPNVDNNQVGWVWGHNTIVAAGAVGDNTEINRSTPVAVCGGHTFCQIVIGTTTTLGLDIHGKAWAWGYNRNGSCGNNSTDNICTPVAVSGNHTFTMLAENDWQTCYGLDNHGMAWGWGYGDVGECGDNATSRRSTPVAVCGGHTFVGIYPINNTAYAIDTNAMVWFWGYGSDWYGGDNTGNSRSTPVAVCGDHSATMLSGMRWNRMLLDTNGVNWCWGQNYREEFGRNNTTGDAATPVNVTCGNHTFCLIAGGYYQSYGVDNHGMAWGWGYNDAGGLGDNSILTRSTPVAVCGDHTFCYIHKHRYNNSFMKGLIGIDYVGKAWAWGINDAGDIGDNSIINRSTPVAVCGNHTFLFIQSGATIRRRSPGGGVAYSWAFNY